MIPICNVREFTGEEKDQPLRSQISSSPVYGKQRIEYYLHKFEPSYAAAMSLKDEITGMTLDTGVSGYEDPVGGWFWDDRMIYHFEKYNMRLSQDFINYVFEHTTAKHEDEFS